MAHGPGLIAHSAHWVLLPYHKENMRGCEGSRNLRYESAPDDGPSSFFVDDRNARRRIGCCSCLYYSEPRHRRLTQLKKKALIPTESGKLNSSESGLNMLLKRTDERDVTMKGQGSHMALLCCIKQSIQQKTPPPCKELDRVNTQILGSSF